MAAGDGLPLADPELGLHLSRCLACRAGETVCPAGVQFGAILELARSAVAAENKPGGLERLLRQWVLRRLISQRPALRGLAALFWLYEKTGLQRPRARKTATPPSRSGQSRRRISWPRSCRVLSAM